MITAPFNFVPLNEKVFFPSWAEDVSHDIPFEDGESGVIDITITAKSPLFIRDHKNPEYFCQHNGEYYIPSTSVKGMVRNILEIMSFSKLSQGSYDDDTYAVRDLSSSKNFYMTQMREEIFCGWLKETPNGYVIEECGVPGRIRHEEIDKALKINFASNFKSNTFEKTSQYKYNILGGTHKKITVGELYKSTSNPKYDKRLFCKYDKNGKTATLVVTGQPTPRKDTGKMGDGKGFEFVFFDVKKETNISNDDMKKFKFAYFDGRNTQPLESLDWTFWKEKLNNAEKVPIFFQKQGNKIAHFGLSYLYKLPYKHSIKDGISKEHFDSRLDLTQTIFGYIDDKEALKGRVSFSHFKAIKNINNLKARTEILGTPRASYYPMYVKQYDGKLFSTYMDSDFSIAGRKKYPIHKGHNTKSTVDTGNENIGTTFTPLKEGVEFQGKMRFHNLKKAELGALLSTLVFHNTSNTYHNIGFAKSLGYGKIDIKLNGIDNLESYLKEFELVVGEQILNWADSIELKELISMSIEQDNSQNSQLCYMPLDDFAKNKTEKSKDYLRSYTQLNNIKSLSVKTLIDKKDLDELKERNKLFLQKQEEYKITKKLKKEHDDAYELLKISENIDQIQSFINKYSDSIYLNEANTMIKKIKLKEQEQREQKAQQEANLQWEKVQKVDLKFKQKALQDFIDNYPKANEFSLAEKELEKLSPSQSKLATDFNLSNFTKFKPLAKNIKKITGNKPLTPEQKDILEAKLIEISKSDKAKNFKESDFNSDNLLGNERVKNIIQ